MYNFHPYSFDYRLSMFRASRRSTVVLMFYGMASVQLSFFFQLSSLNFYETSMSFVAISFRRKRPGKLLIYGYENYSSHGLDERDIDEAHANFAWNLLKQASGNSLQSAILSPLSIAVAPSAAYFRAAGRTKQQLGKVRGIFWV